MPAINHICCMRSRAWRAPTAWNVALSSNGIAISRGNRSGKRDERKVCSSESGAGSGLRRAYMAGIAGSDPGHVGRRGTGMYPAPVAAVRSPAPIRGCCHLDRTRKRCIRHPQSAQQNPPPNAAARRSQGRAG